MNIVKVARRDASAEESEALSRIRDSWAPSNRHMDGDVGATRCSIDACARMPFVALKTSLGRRPICLRHFEMLRAETSRSSASEGSDAGG